MFLNTIYKGLFVTCSLFSIVKNVEVEKTTTGPMFGDIMTNISRVNGLLQDLIKNYEQLKKMSQPDTIESNFSEEDEVFRSKSKYTTAQKIHKVFATAMIVSDTETENNASNSRQSKINKDIDKAKKETRPKKEKRKQPVNKTSKNKKQQRKEKHSEQKVAEAMPKDTALETNDGNKNNDKPNDLMPTLEALRKLIKAFSEETDFDEESNNKSNTFFAPTYSTLSSSANKVPRVIMLASRTTVLAPKTNIHLESTVENYAFPKIEITSRQGSNIARTLKHDKGQRKPIALYLERNSNPNQPNSPQKTLIIVPTNKKKLEPVIELSELDSGSSENIAQEEELKTVMLRQAYGDACLKLVMRKCTMACKAVYKEVCQGSKKCSSTYKNSFKKNAISGCNMQFSNATALSFRGNDDEPSVTNGGFVDLTREGYLSMACSPSTFDRSIKPTIRGKNHSSRTDTQINPLNILRDKYEAACQRTSISKCFKACKFAARESCKVERCGGRKSRALDKACKRRCKQSYGRGYSDDDESEGTSSDSEKSERSEEKADKW